MRQGMPRPTASYGVTVRVPFIPRPAWPSTGQRNVYVPGASVTVNDSVVPGWYEKSGVCAVTEPPDRSRA